MSDRDQSGKGDTDNGQPAPKLDPARQLFGHKGGAKPWEPGQRTSQAAATPSRPAQAASAPYPRDAQYAPRPFEENAEADPDVRLASAIFTEVDDEAELTLLHPNYKLLMRIAAIFIGFLVLVVGLAIDGALQAEEVPIPFGIITGLAVLMALFIVIRIPLARYNARGYQISPDRLRVVRGIMWRSDTIVPFGRIQHIDVDQGPIERALDIATMTLHTAGSHNASVSLPGLGHELAVQMREEIRAHIKRESM
ncbi:PH domain-containing protein [uncultured Erythrobacter sp.]|uniref:PH domain-containing protein n=1 Tax=uncultured Erythrobacter sp. TaxID=263913 RepID=UPI0026176019|nr:PH domain-containing protein [uncultured Erythrobacter sp.]